MKFKLGILDGDYHDRRIDRVEALRAIGFRFEERAYQGERSYDVVRDESLEIEVADLAEVIALVDKVGPVLIGRDNGTGEPYLEIHDGHC